MHALVEHPVRAPGECPELSREDRLESIVIAISCAGIDELGRASRFTGPSAVWLILARL
jgi:hypothetical protein